MKKTIIFAMCICTLLCAGCSKGSSNDSSKSGASASQTESSDKKVKDLETQVDTLAKILATSTGVSKEDILNGNVSDIDIDGDVHAIYDDTAVIDAYKSGDDSKLKDDKDKFILKSLKKAIQDNIKDSMTDYEKEKAVYDYMFSYTHFDDSSLAAINDQSHYQHTPYGFFHDKSTICVGNATTFKLFMDALGIDCKIIHSTESGEHAWNVVKINDKWYHVDLTFDGGMKNPDYAYFNVPDSAKDTGDYPWNKKDFPECNSIDDCLIAKNATELSSIYKLPEALSKAIKNKDKNLFIKVKPEKTDSDVSDSDLVKQYSNILQNISGDTSGYYCNGSSVFINDGYLYIALDIYNTNDINNSDGDQDGKQNSVIDENKLSKAFSDVFKNGQLSYSPIYGDGDIDSSGNGMMLEDNAVTTSAAKG